MDSLYDTLDYYATVEPDGTIEYEEEYHKVTIDPDGKERHLLDEQDHALSGISEITSYVSKLTPGKVLDVGCGLGWFLSSLDKSWDRHGIEISEFASNNASKYGQIRNGTLFEFDWENDSFDLIVMNHVIEHLSNPEGTIQLLHDLLKDDGVFIIGTPDFDSGAARRYGKNYRFLHDPTHISLFSNDSMHRFLRDHGFKIMGVEYPFFETPWFTMENVLKVLKGDGISPPFYGNAMTFFCEKKK